MLVLATSAACGRYGFTSGSADANLDGTSDARVPCAGFDLCDEFEAGSINTALWTKDPSVTIDTARAHRGDASVHIHTDALTAGNGDYEVLSETRTLAGAAAPTTFWVRGWFLIPALPSGPNALELISADQSGAPRLGDFVFLHSDSTSVYSQFGNDILDVTSPPTNRWFCLVWRVVRGTGTTGLLEVTSDVVPTATLPNITTDGAPPISIIAIGLGWAPSNVTVNQPAFDLWVDDVIVHSAPVTCAD